VPFQISKELKRIVQQILRFCLRVACRLQTIHGIKLPDCEEQPVKEAKICMFADDTQLLNKNEEFVEQSLFNTGFMRFAKSFDMIL
jgi:hypothetical protein